MLTQRLHIRAGDDTWVVRAGGAVIGESSRTLEVVEGDLPPVIYFPREDLGMAFLDRSETTSVSARLGQARFFDIVIKSGVIRDAGWSFEAPLPDAERIADHIAFHGHKVTLELV